MIVALSGLALGECRRTKVNHDRVAGGCILVKSVLIAAGTFYNFHSREELAQHFVAVFHLLFGAGENHIVVVTRVSDDHGNRLPDQQTNIAVDGNMPRSSESGRQVENNTTRNYIKSEEDTSTSLIYYRRYILRIL
jgi:hypothetical protein